MRVKGPGGFEDVVLDCAGPLGGWQPLGTSGKYEYTRFDVARRSRLWCDATMRPPIVRSSPDSTLVLAVLACGALAVQGCKKGDDGSTTSTTSTNTTTSTSGVGGGAGFGGIGGYGGAGGYAPCDVVSGGEAVPDGTGDFCDSVSVNTVSYTADWIDLVSETVERTSCASQEQVDAQYNRPDAEHGCQDVNNGVLHVCTTNYLGMNAGGVVAFDMELLGDIPHADTSHSYIYSAVFDSDGDPANNWVYQPPYDWDYFQGADRWYQLIWDRATQLWSLRVTQVDAQQNTTDVPSSARAEVEGSHVRLYIGDDEIPGPDLTWRGTAFGHNNYMETDRGGDVSGADPSEPLVKVP